MWFPHARDPVINTARHSLVFLEGETSKLLDTSQCLVGRPDVTGSYGQCVHITLLQFMHSAYQSVEGADKRCKLRPRRYPGIHSHLVGK